MFQWADWVETRLVNCEILYRLAALFFHLTFGFLQLRGCWVIWTMVPNIILAPESKTEVCIKTKLTDYCVLDLRTVREKRERELWCFLVQSLRAPPTWNIGPTNELTLYKNFPCIYLFDWFGVCAYICVCMCGSKKTTCGVAHLHSPCRS